MQHTVHLPPIDTFTYWRNAARALVLADVAPDHVTWLGPGVDEGLFGAAEASLPASRASTISVPLAFLPLAEAAICHQSPERFHLLYRILWRLQDNRHLLDNLTDADVAKTRAMEKAVRRDAHKMKAFVRFRLMGITPEGREIFAAWFEPDHFIVERTAPFFARRFSTFDWIIATPDLTAFFAQGKLGFAQGGPKPDLPEDASDDLWRTYYINTFNPARLKVKAMMSEMPKKYWHNLPEAALIPTLISEAEKRLSHSPAKRPPKPSAKSE